MCVSAGELQWGARCQYRHLKEVTIKELAETVKEAVGYTGQIIWDQTMPDGTPRKLTDVTKPHGLGWQDKVELEEGVRLAYEWFKDNVNEARL